MSANIVRNAPWRRIGLTLVLALVPAFSLAQQAPSEPTFDGETYNYGLAPVSTIHGPPYEAPTPLTITGATTVTTTQLRAMTASKEPPILIDVIGGNQEWSLPGAIWWNGAGLANDVVQAKLQADLAQVTGGDKAKAIVFFCLSKTCWLSHNAVVRAVLLGYTTGYWYRGGRNAWQAAGLPMAPVKRAPF